MAECAFLIVVVLVVGILVVMLTGDALGLGLAANGAGVFHRAGSDTGAGIGDNALVPFVGFNVLLVTADAAFLIMIVGVMRVPVIVVALKIVAVFRAAYGACIFNDTGDKAVRLLSNNALVPFVGFNVLLVAADAALLIMIVGIVRVLVIVIARDAFGLSLTAGGAGVLHRTGGEAGAGVGDDTVVPCVREHPAEEGIALGAICPVAALVVLELRTDVFRFGDSASAYGAGGAEAGGIGVAAVVTGLHIAAVGAAALAGLVFRIVVLLIQGQSAYAGCLVIAGGILTT